jgi:urease accessory protein UreH
MKDARSPAPLDRRGPADIGTRAALELTFGPRNGRTALVHSYAEPPLRVGRSLETERGVHVILASSAPGLFGGDTIRQTIRVESGAHVSLASQSAMQLHPSSSGLAAFAESRYDVASGAELRCIWDPSIPFADASFQQRIEVVVAAGGRLWWSDAMMGGREGQGERWQFRCYDHELRIQSGDAMAYLERYRLEPHTAPPTHRWAAGDAAYIGSFVRVGYGDTSDVAARVHARFAGAAGVRAEADVLDGDLLLVRIAATAGVAFHRARHTVAAALHEEETSGSSQTPRRGDGQGQNL